MSASYQFSHEHNLQSLLWDAIGAVAALVRRSIGAVAALWACLPAIMTVCAILAKALGLAIALAGVFAVVVAFWLPICQIAGCLAIIAAFAYVTYPRSAVK